MAKKQKERNEYLDTMEDLFGHPGWKLIEEDAKREIYNLQADALDPKVCKTWDDINFKRGRAVQLNELLLLPSMIDAQRDMLEQEDDDNASV